MAEQVGWTEPPKFLRRIGRGHLHADFEDGGALTVLRKSNGVELCLIEPAGNAVVVLFPLDRARPWAAAFARYILGEELEGIAACAPDLPIEPVPGRVT